MKLRCHALALLSLAPAGAIAAGPRAGWLSPEYAQQAKTAGVIYVGVNGALEVYSKSIPAKYLGEITSGISFAQGLFVDADNVLYAASAYGGTLPGPLISIFPPKATAPTKVTSLAMYRPYALAVAPGSSTLYATDVWGQNILKFTHANPNGTALTVSEILYQPGAMPDGIAFSPSGDLYISYNDYTHGTGWRIGKYVSGTHKFADQGISLGTGGSITFDKSGNLITVDQKIGAVEVFAPGATTPSTTFTGFGDPYIVALDPDGTTLYVDDLNNQQIDELAYPSGKMLGSITGFSSIPEGLAASGPAKTPTRLGDR